MSQGAGLLVTECTDFDLRTPVHLSYTQLREHRRKSARSGSCSPTSATISWRTAPGFDTTSRVTVSVLTSEKVKGRWRQRVQSLPKSVKVILFTLIWGGLILALWENGFTMLWRMDFRARDSFFHWRGPQPRPREIIVLTDDGQDDFSDDRYNRFPRPRDLYASAIAKLVDAGAKVVAVDVLFERKAPIPPRTRVCPTPSPVMPTIWFSDFRC